MLINFIFLENQELHELREEITKLREKNAELEEENKNLKYEVETLTYINEQFGQEVDDHKKSIEILERKLSNYSNNEESNSSDESSPSPKRRRVQPKRKVKASVSGDESDTKEARVSFNAIFLPKYYTLVIKFII